MKNIVNIKYKQTLSLPATIEFDLTFNNTYYTGTGSGFSIYESVSTRNTYYGYPETGAGLGRVMWHHSYTSGYSGKFINGAGIFSDLAIIKGLSTDGSYKIEIKTDRTYTLTYTDRPSNSSPVIHKRTGTLSKDISNFQIEFNLKNYSSGKETYIDNIKIIED